MPGFSWSMWPHQLWAGPFVESEATPSQNSCSTEALLEWDSQERVRCLQQTDPYRVYDYPR